MAPLTIAGGTIDIAISSPPLTGSDSTHNFETRRSGRVVGHNWPAVLGILITLCHYGFTHAQKILKISPTLDAEHKESHSYHGKTKEPLISTYANVRSLWNFLRPYNTNTLIRICSIQKPIDLLPLLGWKVTNALGSNETPHPKFEERKDSEKSLPLLTKGVVTRQVTLTITTDPESITRRPGLHFRSSSYKHIAILFSFHSFPNAAFALPVGEDEPDQKSDQGSSVHLLLALSGTILITSIIMLVMTSRTLAKAFPLGTAIMPLTGFISVASMMAIKNADQMPAYGPYVICTCWLGLAMTLFYYERIHVSEQHRDMFTVLSFLVTGGLWYAVVTLSPDDTVAAIPLCFVLGTFIASRLRRYLYAVLLAIVNVFPSEA